MRIEWDTTKNERQTNGHKKCIYYNVSKKKSSSRPWEKSVEGRSVCEDRGKKLTKRGRSSRESIFHLLLQTLEQCLLWCDDWIGEKIDRKSVVTSWFKLYVSWCLMCLVSSYFPVQSFVSSVVAVVFLLFFTEDEDEAEFPFQRLVRTSMMLHFNSFSRFGCRVRTKKNGC